MRKTSLQEYLFEGCERNPDSLAARDGRKAISYEQLFSESCRLANCLRSLGVRRGDRVVLSLRRSVSWFSAIFGTLCCGSAYLPVDPEKTGMRLRSIIKDSRPSAIVTDHIGLKAVLPAVLEDQCRPPLVVLEDQGSTDLPRDLGVVFQDQLLQFSSSISGPGSSEVDLAYIMYTSGSTGKPKGVMISHGNVINYVEWAVKHFRLHNGDRILGTAPFSFDMSTFDIYAPLRAGAATLIAPDGMTLFPARLVRFMEQERATVWKGIASLLMYISRVGALRNTNLENLRLVMFAGERLPASFLADWMKALPETEFHNCYGPTETTGVSMSYRVPKIPLKGEQIPIGGPLKKGMKAFLADENGTEVPTGHVGEILLAGSGLSKGYWNDGERTKAVFGDFMTASGTLERVYRTGDLGRVRADGCMEFAGRKDRQVKIMGYRIELEEIECHLMMNDGVEEAVVLAVPSGSGDHDELVGFYTGSERSPDLLRDSLEKSLPPYMVPKKIYKLKELPRCPRGKILFEALGCSPEGN